jgi:hypothetical protein
METKTEAQTRPAYRKDPTRRPWKVFFDAVETLNGRLPMWLVERGGIVVYENHMMDSSHRGEQTFMPVRFLASEDNALHWAPLEHRPDGGLPSLRQEQVDLIELSDFPDTTPAAIIGKCFMFEEAPPKPKKRKRGR